MLVDTPSMFSLGKSSEPAYTMLRTQQASTWRIIKSEFEKSWLHAGCDRRLLYSTVMTILVEYLLNIP
jgi:hypothetical protein